MRDDFDALIADRFAMLDDLPAPDIWSRVQAKLVDPMVTPFIEAEPTTIDLEAPTQIGGHGNRRPLIGALVGVAAAATLIGALVIVNGRENPDRLPPVDSTPDTLPATTTPAPPTTPLVSVGVSADQMMVIRELVDAINTGDADAFLGVVAPEGGFDPQGVFAESSMEGLFPLQQAAEEPLVRAWISIADSWDLEIELTSCRQRVPADDGGDLFRNADDEDGFVLCELRTRWHKLSLELAEEWQVNLRGQELTWFGQWGTTPLVDLNPQPRRLPLGYDGLEAWETWLERTNPDAAARYLNPRAAPEGCNAECVEHLAPNDPALAARLATLYASAEHDWVIDGHRFHPNGVIPYDPQWADEIEGSIQEYLDEDSDPGS